MPDFEVLESMIDRLGAYGVLEIIERICYAKEEHVKANWQDMALGTLWARIASRVGAAAAVAQKLP